MGEGAKEVPALFAGGGQNRAERGKGLGSSLGAEAAGDFLFDLHHTQVLLSLIISKRHVGMGEEAQHVVLAGLEAQEQVMPDAAALAATAAGALEWWLGGVESQALGDDPVIASKQIGEKPGGQAARASPGQICGMTGLAQKAGHGPRPGLLFDLDQRTQFPQMMGVAQAVEDTGHSEIGVPVVVDDDPDDIGPQLAPLAGGAVARQQPRRGHMQPWGQTANTKAGLIQVLDRSLVDVRANRGGQLGQVPSLLVAHRRDGGGREVNPKHIAKKLRQAIFRHQLPTLQIDDQRRQRRPILRRRGHLRRKRGLRCRPTVRTTAPVRSMFGDVQRLRLWQIEYLPLLIRRRCLAPQRLAAARAR